jgi:hypothetical protein
MATNDHSNQPSTEATPSEKQTSTGTDVRPNDASLSEAKRLPTELPPAQKAAKTGSSDAPLVSAKVANQNARKHGLYSNYVLYPWEAKDDFNGLHQEFRDEWKPNGCSEEQAVFDLAYLTWLKWRAVASAKIRFFQTTTSAELKSGASSWGDIIEHQKKVPAHARGALSAATKLMDDMTATYEKIRQLPYWTDDSEGKEIQDQLFHLKHDFSVLNEQVKKEVIEGVRALVKMVEDSANRFAEAYHADEIEKEVDRLGKFDVRMEKIIRRIIQIKVFKRVDGVDNSNAPLLEAPSLVPIQGSTEKSSSNLKKR